MRRLVTVELAKLASVRSSWVLVAATGALSGLSVTTAIAAGTRLDVDVATDAGKHSVLHGSGTGAVFALVLGIMLTAGEFRHGTITDTYLTTPDRRRATMAKFGAGLLFGPLLGLVAALVTVAVAGPWLAAKGHPLPFDRGYVWLTLLGAVLWCAGYAVIGVAVGALVRNQVLAVIGALAWLFVAEQLVMNLASDVGRWLPASAAAAAGRTPQDGLLPQWGGTLALVGYAVAIVVAAALTTMRRDVT